MKWYFKIFKDCTNFKERTGKTKFWAFTLINFFLLIAISCIAELTECMLLIPIYLLIVLIPMLAITVRRIHDIGKSGWFALIPIYNLVLCYKKGTAGFNRYGPDPKNEPI